MTERLDVREVLQDFEGLVAEVHARSRLHRSRDHGDHHWRLVAWTGAELYEEMGAGDPLVFLLFGLFHDSQRENEYTDPEHGKRGGKLAGDLLASRGLDASVVGVVTKACAIHTESGPVGDPTLGTCLDSDRLNLWRVGTEPLPEYLSTPAAKKPERIEWARDLQTKQPEWGDIRDCYRDLLRD
jgi:uncharacterized protein